MNKSLALIVSCFVLLLSSCKVKKPVSGEVPVIHKLPKVKQFVAGVKSDETQFEYLQAKISGKLNLDSSFPVRGMMKIQKDSVIWCSFQYSGIEVARLRLMPNRFQLIDRWNKEYIDTNFDAISTRLGVDVNFNMLQSLLIGTPLVDPNQEFYSYRDQTNYVLSNTKKNTRESKLDVFFNYVIGPASFRPLKQVYAVERGATTLSAEYPGYTKSDNISPELRIKLEGKKTISANWTFSKVDTSKTLSFPFKISSKYSRIDF